MSLIGVSLHWIVAFLLRAAWPEDYDFNHFNIVALDLMLCSVTAVVLAILYVATKNPASVKRLISLQCALLAWNFLIALSDETVNRFFNPQLFLQNPEWSLPDLSMFRWWMTADDFMPLAGLLLFWYMDRGRTHQTKVWGPDAG